MQRLKILQALTLASRCPSPTSGHRRKKTKANFTRKGVGSAITLNHRKNMQDMRLGDYTPSPPRPLFPHLAPQMNPIPVYGVRVAFTTLQTLG
jgi:hypothetical protein